MGQNLAASFGSIESAQSRSASSRSRLPNWSVSARNNMAVIYDNKVAQVRRLSEALLMLDTSRIVARGYAIVQKNQKVVESSAGIEEKMS